MKFLADEALREFWEFATTVHRSRSLAAATCRKVRGSWITDSLAVQRVHGWGPRSVRLLCVHVASEERRERFRLFFRRDRRNLEGQLATIDSTNTNNITILQLLLLIIIMTILNTIIMMIMMIILILLLIINIT